MSNSHLTAKTSNGSMIWMLRAVPAILVVMIFATALASSPKLKPVMKLTSSYKNLAVN